MKQIRDHIWQISYTELGKPSERGYYKVANFGEVLIDLADMHYITTYLAEGYEPAFFVSKSPALGGAFVVIGRNRHA